MRKTLVGLTALAAVAAPIAITTAPAQAANPPCASRAEFSRIHIGQSPTTVAKIVGSNGKVSMASSYLTIRQYKVCTNPYGVMTIGYSGGRVQSKSYIG